MLLSNVKDLLFNSRKSFEINNKISVECAKWPPDISMFSATFDQQEFIVEVPTPAMRNIQKRNNGFGL